jgi:hypothetical protein
MFITILLSIIAILLLPWILLLVWFLFELLINFPISLIKGELK